MEFEVFVIEPDLISNFPGCEAGINAVLHEKGSFFVGGNSFFPSFREKGEAFFQFREEGLSDLRIGLGFIAHHERKGGDVGNRVGGGVVREFRHGKEFGPFRRLVLGKDSEIRLEFLVDPFRFSVALRVIGG